MAENVEGHRGRRGRWLVLAVLLAIAVWVVRSQRAARPAADSGWPPRPVGTGTATAPAPQPGGAPRRPSPRPRPAPTP
ncbi:hypothetical protein [Pseudonocardia adelaidensis]|uniref:Uncharacterized protein n=1 Tax=Pseudonocardia adelaidensis TaxID=648754 RepID=A0ABP9NSD1_9PSEU